MKTTSLELSKELKEAGFPQNRKGMWYVLMEPNTYHFAYNLLQVYIDDDVAAPTADEILDVLPAYIEDMYPLSIQKGPVVYTWLVRYENKKDTRFICNSLAEAAGKLYIYLKKNNLL